MRAPTAILILCASALASGLPARSGRATVEAVQEAPFAFRAAGVYPRGGASSLRVRASADGIRWSDWVETSAEDGGGAFAWFESPQRWIEVDAPAEVLFIDPGETRSKIAPKRHAVDAPPMVSREQWGCPPDACAFRGGSPAYSTVTHMVVHHTAGANSATDWAAVMRSLWTLHVQGNGWSDIGYNYVIGPNGVLYEGRQGGPGVIGAHFSGVNTGTMGVSLMGTYSNLRPPEPALRTLAQMLAWHAERWNLDPGAASLHASSQLRLSVISGHRDAGLSPRASGTTECPGNGLYVLLPSLRAEVRRTLAAAGVTLPDAGAPCPEGVPCLSGVLPAGARESLPVVAGSWASVYGSNLASGVAVAPEGVLPVSLGGVSITINGNRQAPLLYVSPSQINFQAPPGVPTGSARLTLVRDGSPPVESLFWVTEAAPSLFLIQNHEDGSIHSEEAPARAGSAVIVYLTGAGPVNGTFPNAGMPAPQDALLAARLPWTAHAGGRELQRIFLGLTPGLVGLYQANVVLPADLPAGTYDITVTVAGATSAPLPLHVAVR